MATYASIDPLLRNFPKDASIKAIIWGWRPSLSSVMKGGETKARDYEREWEVFAIAR